MELSGFWYISDSGSATFTGVGNQHTFLLLPVLLWSLYLSVLIVPINAVLSLGLLCLASLGNVMGTRDGRDQYLLYFSLYEELLVFTFVYAVMGCVWVCGQRTAFRNCSLFPPLPCGLKLRWSCLVASVFTC